MFWKRKIHVECKILQPELVRPQDLFVFTFDTPNELVGDEMVLLKEGLEKFLKANGIENKIVCVNNGVFQVIRSVVL